MARFTNFATLSYNGGSTDSNVVTGELLETLTMSKTAVMDDYTARDDVTYVISILNSGAAPISGLTLTDDLGGYSFNGNTLYPLSYTAGSLRCYINGVLQTVSPTVTAGPPLTISGINVPAGGNVLLIYETTVTAFAPLGLESTITNTASLTGGGLTAPLIASTAVSTRPRAELTISKALSPVTVTENGQLTYTFVIENSGSLAADASEQAVLTDTFNPILNPITVTFNSTAWTEGTNYTYDAATGIFSTIAGQITVPAATYTQNSDGTWTTTPGIAELVITGTV